MSKMEKTFNLVEKAVVTTVTLEVTVFDCYETRRFSNHIFYMAYGEAQFMVLHESGLLLSKAATEKEAQALGKKYLSNLTYKTDLGCRVQGHKNLVILCSKQPKKLERPSLSSAP